MIKYPISFHTQSDSTFGIQSTWTSTSQDFPISCSIPVEFEGPGGALSPEDLFAKALTNCFVATFKVYAEKSKILFRSIVVKSELIVDFSESKKPVMKKCHLQAEIYGCENPERGRLIAQKAFDSGFILNSVKTEVSLNLNFLN